MPNGRQIGDSTRDAAVRPRAARGATGRCVMSKRVTVRRGYTPAVGREPMALCEPITGHLRVGRHAVRGEKGPHAAEDAHDDDHEHREPRKAEAEEAAAVDFPKEPPGHLSTWQELARAGMSAAEQGGGWPSKVRGKFEALPRRIRSPGSRRNGTGRGRAATRAASRCARAPGDHPAAS